MLSRLLCRAPYPPNLLQPIRQNLNFKRFSGHNTMEIHPSDSEWMDVKNWIHFYALLTAIPTLVGITIVNIRANPVLSEVPEGYEPRNWEYHKHPITRWMVKHLYVPMEREHEVRMGLLEYTAESYILRKIELKVKKAMAFYNDHRSRSFEPFYGESTRTGRDEAAFGLNYTISNVNTTYDMAFDPTFNPVPTEGYPDGPPRD